MDKEVITAIGVAAGAILTPLCAALVGARGTHGETDANTIKRLKKELAAERADAEAERRFREEIAASRAETAAVRAEMAEADRRADAELRDAREEAEQRRSGVRWHELTLFWFGMAHTLRHAARNARASAEVCARLHGEAAPA